MAIFHLAVKCLSRSSQCNAINAAAYRSGSRLQDDLSGQVFNYTRRLGVAHTQIFLPDEVSPIDRSTLWNYAERAEKRRNSTIVREVVVALATELKMDQHVQLVQQFSRWLVGRYGFAVDAAIHRPTRKNDERNWHAHLMCTTRVLRPTGLAEKCRVLDVRRTGSVEIKEWREHWAKLMNEALRQQIIPVRVYHRSHAKRGLNQIPTVKVGRGPGHRYRWLHNQNVRQQNVKLSNIDYSLTMLQQERARLEAELLRQRHVRQVDAAIATRKSAEIQKNDELAKLWLSQNQFQFGLMRRQLQARKPNQLQSKVEFPTNSVSVGKPAIAADNLIETYASENDGTHPDYPAFWRERHHFGTV